MKGQESLLFGLLPPFDKQGPFFGLLTSLAGQELESQWLF